MENGVDDLESFLDAYHVQPKSNLQARKGAIQGALCLEISGEYCDGPLEDFQVLIEGQNGLLPNLDLVNTLKKIGSHREVNIASCHGSRKDVASTFRSDKYLGKLFNMFSMCCRQAFGYPRNLNGPFLNNRIDAVVLTAREGPTRENEEYHKMRTKAFYEVVEGTFRSLNNLLEHLHQSFFFYLLPDDESYVSISNFVAIPFVLCLSILIKVCLRELDSLIFRD